MLSNTSLEKRLVAVEAAIAELQKKIADPQPVNWLQQITGSFKYEPAFEEQDAESLSLLNNPDFISIIENAKQEFEAGKTLSLEQMKQEFLLGD
ncbi:MAG: hypothetical protein F6K47_42270 [Symploca sp. SIO2E6]|nr:hypothetical protein [Symploca sp. SIO2E6]